MIAALTLLLIPIQLYPNTVTGKVNVARRECFAAPCPQGPVTVGNVELSGPMADDVAAFDGKTVTVKGVETTRPQLGAPGAKELKVQSFAPGRDGDFMTGKISEYCLGAGGTGNGCQAFIKVGKTSLKIDQSQYLKGLGALSGQTVTLYGTYKESRIGGGGELIFEPASDKVSVKGKLGTLEFAAPRLFPAPIIPHVGDYLLSMKGGSTIIVDTKAAQSFDNNDKTEWVTGTLQQGGGDLATYIKGATLSSEVVKAGLGKLPGGSPIQMTGSNVSRNDATSGATTQNAAQTTTANGGFHH